MQLLSRQTLGAGAAGIRIARSYLVQSTPDHFERTMTLKSASRLSIVCEGPGTGCDLEVAVTCFGCFLEWKGRKRMKGFVFLAIS